MHDLLQTAPRPRRKLTEIMSSLRREIAMRQRVYPGLVVKEKMKAAQAAYEIECMTDALSILAELSARGGGE